MNTLKNNNYEIKINSLGAELKSLKFKNEEYLHKGDKFYWHRSSPILFPIVGRLKNNNYKYKNKNYSLPIHGFARFQDFVLIERTAESLTFLLKENEATLKHYPFTFNLYIKYVLEENQISIEYKINSKEDIVFGFGAHPAFLLKANIDDTFIKFEKEENQKAYKLDLQNGCIKNQDGLELKNNILNLHNSIFDEDALIYKNLNSSFVTLKNQKNDKSVKIKFENFPYLGIWSKKNAPYVCLEPWCSCADYINTNYNFEDKKDIIKLKANEDFERKIIISLN